MRILVTGSKGLIGSSLIRKLEMLGLEVVEYDICIDAAQTLLDPLFLSQKLQGCQGVIHLAAVSRVIFGERHPELCWKTNVEGTQNVLEGALKASSRPWVIYASSREVYGQQPKLPVAESAPLDPVNIYGRSKAAAEAAVLQARKRGLKVGILRFSNVYGSVNDYEDRVIPAFCRRAVLGEDLIVEGNDNLFDFTYIDDVVRGIVSMISKLGSSSEPLPPIHLTTGQATRLRAAAGWALKAANSCSKVVQGTPRSFDVATFYGDPGRARRLLDWEATVFIEEGMARLVQQFELLVKNHPLQEVNPNPCMR